MQIRTEWALIQLLLYRYFPSYCFIDILRSNSLKYIAFLLGRVI
jgi:hypothetical protein